MQIMALVRAGQAKNPIDDGPEYLALDGASLVPTQGAAVTIGHLYSDGAFVPRETMQRMS